jgi:hypothetical protein
MRIALPWSPESEVVKMKMLAKTLGPVYLARLAAPMVLAVPVGVTQALAIALSTAVLTTTLTTFSPLLSVMSGRWRTRGF